MNNHPCSDFVSEHTEVTDAHEKEHGLAKGEAKLCEVMCAATSVPALIRSHELAILHKHSLADDWAHLSWVDRKWSI
eukprot:SAG31_NODE_64_length_28590_cov_17.914464_28_plen_77_part_00